MRLLIALNENKGLNSKLSEHFGHCGYFAIFNTQTKKFEIVENKIEHANETLTPVDQVMKFNPDVVFSLGIGQRAIKLFEEKTIKLKTGKFIILKEVIDNIDNLQELNSGCLH